MSRLIAQILRAVLLFPITAVFQLLTFCLIDDWRRQSRTYNRYDSEAELVVCALLTAIFVAVYWILLWKSAVRWTRARIGQTIAAAVASLVVSIGIGRLLGNVETDVSIFVGGVCFPLLWLLATTWIWRETRLERLSRLSQSSNALICPTCGYNLTGLSEPRCPECGTRFTLEELFAHQPHKDADELKA